MRSWAFGEVVPDATSGGRQLLSTVFDENQVRAAAGLTMVVGAVAFVYAYFNRNYLPLQVVTTFFAAEFLIRVVHGLRYSPVGLVARLLTWRYPPQWVSATPKRFAWTLGLGLSVAMAVITNSGVRGLLPRTICLICLTLMWLESVVGLCIGCEIYGFAARRRWIGKSEAFEVCAHGVCEVPQAEEPSRSIA
jgi:hypothetical protein